MFGHECIYLAARDQTGQLAGVLPLVRVKSLLFGHYLVSMPFVNYGGPLGDDVAVGALLAYFSTEPDEALDGEPARPVRVMIAGILAQEDGWSVDPR